MTTQTILPVDAERLSELSQKSGEPVWLKESRLKALELAATLTLPKLEKTRIDRWNVNTYGSYKAGQSLAALSEAPASIAALIKDQEEGSLIIQHNSGVVYTRLAPELAAQGVIFTDLQTAVKEHGDLVQRYLHKAVQPDEHSIAALHAALWNGGVFLYVPKNVIIETPLQAVLLTDDA